MFNTERFLQSLVLGCALALSACQHPASTTSSVSTITVPECSCIREAATGKALPPAQLLATLSKAPIVIVGEEHTNVQHHLIEQWLLQNLPKARSQGSVLMEMVDISQQASVDRVKATMRSGSVVSESRVQEAIRWNAGWPWPLYSDVVMTALEGHYPLIAANISRAQVNELYNTPTFPAGAQSTNPQVHNALSAIIYLMHDGKIEGEQLTAMMAIQQQRDRFMAEQLMKAPRPALLIAGGYHATKDIGVPLHLADLQADKPVVLMLTTKKTALTSKQADYIWSVPVEE